MPDQPRYNRRSRNVTQGVARSPNRSMYYAARRRAAWVRPAPRYTDGVLAKFAALASSASRGAVTG